MRSASRSRTSPSSCADDPDEVERRVERAIDSLHLTIRDIRNFIFGLRPELLSGTTLLTGLAAIVEEFRHNSMIDVELQAGAIDIEPDATTTAHLLGVVSEALSATSRATPGRSRAMVWISTEPDDGLRLRIEDNGRGLRSDGDREPGSPGAGQHALARGDGWCDHGHRERCDRHSDRRSSDRPMEPDADEEIATP